MDSLSLRCSCCGAAANDVGLVAATAAGLNDPISRPPPLPSRLPTPPAVYRLRTEREGERARLEHDIAITESTSRVAVGADCRMR